MNYSMITDLIFSTKFSSNFHEYTRPTGKTVHQPGERSDHREMTQGRVDDSTHETPA